jgi:formylglycine-generating enzyme required for sulfatase activity
MKKRFDSIMRWAETHRGAAVLALASVLLGLIGLPLVLLGYIDLIPFSTSTPTHTPTPTFTDTATITPSPSSTSTSTNTSTPTITPTPEPPTSTPTPRPYVGHVFDAATGDPIEGAKVRLAIEGAPDVVYTDSEGVFRFTLPEEKSLSGRIFVEAEGYKRQNRLVEIRPSRPDLEDFRLESAPADEGTMDGTQSIEPIQRTIVLCPNSNDMIFVKQGPFIMGSTQEEIELFAEGCPPPKDLQDCGARFFDDELPQRKIWLDAFCIDMFEVTNSKFARFVEETGYETTAEKRGTSVTWNEQDKVWNQDVAGANWRNPHGPDTDIVGLENHPVVQVSLKDAEAYCEWEGKRLPTGEEWEKAARGPDGYIYPWGNDWDGNKLNYYARRTPGTEKIGSYPDGASYYGVEDMLGNVLEWVDSPNPNNPTEYGRRGGGWATIQVYLHSAWLNFVPPESTAPTTGFRCAKSLTATD